MSGVFLRIVIPWFCTCGRQLRHGQRHAVLHHDQGRVHVGADVEGDRQRVRAVVAHLRRHVEHALDAVDLLLDRRRHRVGHHRGAGPGIADRDRDARRRDPGILRDRQEVERDPADQGDDDGQDRREDRPIDEEPRDHGRLRLSAWCGSSRAADADCRSSRATCERPGGGDRGLAVATDAGRSPDGRLPTAAATRFARCRRGPADGLRASGGVWVGSTAWTERRHGHPLRPGPPCAGGPAASRRRRPSRPASSPSSITRRPSSWSAPGRDPAVLDLVLGVEHVDELQPLVRRHGPVDDQQRRVRLADRQADPHEHAGRQQPLAPFGRLGLGKTPRTRMLPVVGIDLVVHEVDRPLVREALLALQAHEDRHLDAVLGHA